MGAAEPILLVKIDSVDTMTVKRALKDLKLVNQPVCTDTTKRASFPMLTITSNCPEIAKFLAPS